MSADLLRQAAALMRERADRVTAGPWVLGPDRCVRGDDREILWDDSCQEKANDLDDGIYIASWHPAVALAVADWLDACAQFMEDEPAYTHDGEDYAMNVARAYLGGAS